MRLRKREGLTGIKKELRRRRRGGLMVVVGLDRLYIISESKNKESFLTSGIADGFSEVGGKWKGCGYTRGSVCKSRRTLPCRERWGSALAGCEHF